MRATGLSDGALLRILRGLIYLPQGIVLDEAVERETALSAEVYEAWDKDVRDRVALDDPSCTLS